MCLSPHPTYAPRSMGLYGSATNEAARVYGIEYNRWGSTNAQGPNNRRYQTGACAVCRVTQPGEIYENWGSWKCPAIHTTLYQGWIMADRHNNNNRRTEFVCVDDKMESTKTQGGQTDSTQNYWYPTESEGGAMHEEFYPHNWEVFCSVCQVPYDQQQGEIFTRWGHNDCPDRTQLLYTGLVGGAHHNHGGSGVNSICLTRDSNHKPGGVRTGNDDGALLYGVEYEHNMLDQNDHETFYHDHDAGCAVCQMTEPGNVFTTWGSMVCGPDSAADNVPKSHRGSYELDVYELYHGMVFSSHMNRKRFSYRCVDDQHARHMGTRRSGESDARWYITIFGNNGAGYTTDWNHERQGGYGHGQEGSRRYQSRDDYHGPSYIACAVCAVPTQPDHEGDIYTRWGKNTCGETSTALYRGFIGQSRYDRWGSGPNALCLTLWPNPNKEPSAGEGRWWNRDSNGAHIYGTEYHRKHGGFSDVNHDGDAACVVCQTKKARNVWTSWGNWECPIAPPSGRTKKDGKHSTDKEDREYSGIIMAGRYDWRTQEHICVDPAREVHPADNQGSDRHSSELHVAESRGSATRSFNYESNQAMMCSVCKAAECPKGHFAATFGAECKACTACKSDEYESPSKRCTTHSDRSCAKCATAPASSGYFMSTPCSDDYGAGVWQACSAECADDEYEVMGCNKLHDRQCEKRTVCEEGKDFAVQPATKKSDAICMPVSPPCKASTQWQLAAPTPVSDRVCFDWGKGCSSGFYLKKPTDGEDPCIPVKECTPNQYETKAPTANGDRECAALDECSDSQYQSRSPSPKSNRECKALTMCSPGVTYESRAPVLNPTGTFHISNRECSPVTVCDEFELVAGTDTSDAVCGSHRNDPCPPGMYITSEGSGKNRRQCAECAAECSGAEVMVQGCAGTKNRICARANAVRETYAGTEDIKANGNSLRIIGESVQVVSADSTVDLRQKIAMLQAQISETKDAIKYAQANNSQ